MNIQIVKRLPELDVLRIFSAFLVLIYHWSGRGGFYPKLINKYELGNDNSILEFLASYGFVGVDIFFILSGAVISRSLQKYSGQSFLKSRFVRLYPTYLLANIIAIIFVPIAIYNTNRNSYFFSLSGLNFWTGDPYLITSAWTLPYEINFYVLVFLFCVIKKPLFDRSRFLNNCINSWLIFSIVFCNVVNPSFRFLLNLDYSYYFILGWIISEIDNRYNLVKNLPRLTVAFAMCHRELVARLNNSSELKHNYIGAFVILFLVGVFMLNAFMVKQENRSGNYRWLKVFSLMTYPVYLLHESVGMSLISKIHSIGLNISVAKSSTLVIILGASYFMVTYIDERFKKLFLKYFAY